MTNNCLHARVREISVELFTRKHPRKPEAVIQPHAVKRNTVQFVPTRTHFYTQHRSHLTTVFSLTLYGHIKTAEQQTIIRQLVHWTLIGGLLHLVQRGGAWAGYGPTQSPPCCTKCNSPPINGHCTNCILFNV